MSTVKATHFEHPSASTPGITLASDGTVVLPAGFTGGIGSNVVSTDYTTAFSASLAAGAFTNPSGFSVTITPTSATSKVLILVHLSGLAKSFSDINVIATRLMRGATAIAIPPVVGSRPSVATAYYMKNTAVSEEILTTSFHHLDSPATTSPVVYSVEVSALAAATVYVNRTKTDTDNSLNMRALSSITAIEVAA